MKSNYTGIARIFRAFGNSWAGVCSAFQNEAAFRQDILVFIIGTVVLLMLPVMWWRRALMFASLIFILIAELVNTAIENTIDRIGPEYHELSKHAKDIGSAVVLMAFVCAIVVWVGMLV